MKLLKENNTVPMKTKIVYHGSFYKFDSFDMEAVLKNKTRNHNYGAGFYFTESEEQARLFGDYIYKCRIKYSTDYRTAKRLGTVKDYTYIESKGYWIIPYECVGNIQILDRKYVGETLTESTKIFNVGRVEVIQNPTDTEFRQMYKEQRELHPFVTDPLIRHTYGEFGNYYIWPAYDSTHYSIELYIYKTFGERTNQNKDYDLFNHYYLDESLGYRTETAYGSGVRDLRSVLEFEIVYLGNSDIPETLLTTFNLTKEQQAYIRSTVDNIEDLSDENKQKLVDVCIDIIKREFPNAKYCLWLADKNVIIDYYGGIEETIDEYEIENLKPISDLGWEGKLYVYSELPKPIRK